MKNPNLAAALTAMLCITLLCGCVTTSAPTAPTRNISEKKEAMSIPDYSFTPSASESAPSGYTVGIIDMVVNEDVPEGWVTTIGLSEFREAYFSGLESVFLSKGIPIKGPFDSYEEMTFPDRDSCSYLIRPVLQLNVRTEVGAKQLMSEYTEKQRSDTTLSMTYHIAVPCSATYACTMRYEIFEPLTGEKLAIHKLDSEPIVENTSLVAVERRSATWNGSEYVDNKPTTFTLGPKEGFHNAGNMSHRALERLFKNYMPKTETLLSVAEFAHLDQYKKKLEDRKRY